MTEDHTETLDWALRYHAAGWQIFPCRNKEPHYKALETWNMSWQEAVESGQINEGVIRWWWERFPDAQIAVACGAKPGITVIDIDWMKDPATNQPLYDQGEKPCDLMTRWCTSMTSITGSGGRHVFCKYIDIANSAKTVHPQVDIRSQGGYVILPPSVHANGKKYAWDPLFPWGEQGLCNLATFPTELRSHSSAATSGKAAWGERWRSLIEGVAEGSRNVSAAALAGKLIHSFDPHTAWDLLNLWNAHRNAPPLQEQELLTTYLSILKRDYAKRPRSH